MHLKKKKFNFLLLISRYKYKTNVDLDYFYFITHSLKYCGYKYLLVQFDKKDKITNIEKIKNFLKKKNVIIIAEANIEYNYLYPDTFIDLIKKKKT